MDRSTGGSRPTGESFSMDMDNCCVENDVTAPRDKSDTDPTEMNKAAVNQELDSPQDNHQQIEVSSENDETCDTDACYDCSQKPNENRKCDCHENSKNLARTTSSQQVTGYTSIVEDECRICQSAGDEALISPCKCSGSAKWVHESCIVKWFQISDTSSCELCARDVSLKKRTKPLHEVGIRRL